MNQEIREKQKEEIIELLNKVNRKGIPELIAFLKQSDYFEAPASTRFHGNIKNFLQICKIYYYPPEQDYPLDKVWLYFDGEENKQPRRIRSLCFKNPENHKQFIINNIYAHIYQLIKRAEYNNALSTNIPKRKYQEEYLDYLLREIRGFAHKVHNNLDFLCRINTSCAEVRINP